MPGHTRYFGLETGITVEIVFLTYVLTVLENLWRVGIFFLGDKIQLFAKWQVDIGFDVTGCTRIAVPIPGSAKIAALLDDSNALDSGFTESRSSNQTAKATTNNNDLDRILEGLPFNL